MPHMKNHLIIVTNQYPFDVGEVFLETEIPYLAEEFDHVYLLSLSPDPRLTRKVPAGMKVERYADEGVKWRDVWGLLTFVCGKTFRDELNILKQRYGLKLDKSIIKSMLGTMYHGEKIYRSITKLVEENEMDGKIYIYSYWMNEAAYAAGRFKEANRHAVCAICRSHGYDLYFERHANRYLPFRNYIASHLDAVYPISNDGLGYLQKKIDAKFAHKLKVSRLGINNHYDRAVQSTDGTLRIVSCSFIRKVKRLELIIDALSAIDGMNVIWTHIGDGELRDKMERYAAEKLGKKENVRYQFLGHLTNSEVMKHYSANPTDLLINVSESEGIPVSMMEACSFGIPIIATKVGGVGEIVENGVNGWLLSPHPDAGEVKAAVMKYHNLSIEEKEKYRDNAYRIWNEFYHAEKNYRAFIREMKEIGMNKDMR